jgi:hypothetical protein
MRLHYYGPMKRFGWKSIAVGIVMVQGGMAWAQNSIQALEEELKEAKQAHQDLTSQAMTNFFAQVDAAMGSPDAAVALYQQAGGAIPDPVAVVTANESETETEKQARLAIDQANLTNLSTVLQLQCGMMHYAALFVVDPNRKGLQDDWVAWLQKAAQAYPQLANAAQQAALAAPKPDGGGHHKKKDRQDDAPPPAAPRGPTFNPSDLAGKAMRDTVISKYLAFTAWGDKEQGQWAVHDIPKLYRSNVLDPSRANPTAATLANWDVYIAMANAEEKDNNKWNQDVYPPLQFDRAADDYAVSPGTEKLEGLVNLIKANPTNPHADDWISRVRQLMDAYKAAHGGAPAVTRSATPAPSSPTPSTNLNVTVTTQQQGDMTIVTTHTNAAPNPAPPAQ